MMTDPGAFPDLPTLVSLKEGLELSLSPVILKERSEGLEMPKEVALRRADETDKVKELILLVTERSEGDESFGMVKLNKLLFDIDFTQYGRAGHSVTDQEYQAQPLGPTLRRMLPLVHDLEQENALAIKKVPVGEYTQDRPVALRPADLGRFSADELALVDEIVRMMKGETATSVSDLSHEFIGWQVARQGETIPYETVFLSNRPLTEREKDIGRRLAAS